MAKFSKKMGGKEVGGAEVYAEPHGGTPGKEGMTPQNVNMTVGNLNRDALPGVKTSGIKIRGTGAATKGLYAKGPMA